MTDQIWWYATRAAGLMTWATAMASICLGLTLSFSNSRRLRWLPSKPWMLDLHRFVGGMSVMFLALHMVTLWADSFVHFAWAELLIPGASEWRPLAVAWGVVAAWLLAAVEGTSLLKDHLPKRAWHGVHLGSYLVALLGTVHAVSAGSDVDHPVVFGVGAAMLAIVVGLTVLRVATLRTTTPSAARTDQLERARRLRDRGSRSLLPSLVERLAEARAKRPQPAPATLPVRPQQPMAEVTPRHSPPLRAADQYPPPVRAADRYPPPVRPAATTSQTQSTRQS